MSIQNEISRIASNVSAAYAAIAEKGGILPAEQTSASLAAAVGSIPASSAPSALPDPIEIYRSTRPSDWLPMPEPQDDEIYLLLHIPDWVSSLLAFTVVCGSSTYTVAIGTVENGTFVQSSSTSVASGQKFETELSAEDFDNLTGDGMKQCMIKISGTDITIWEPSPHSMKKTPSNFAGWDIVEIACRLPGGSRVACGNNIINAPLRRVRYFSWYGTNRVSNMGYMFHNCSSLVAIPHLDTAYAKDMTGMFTGCSSLLAVPQMDTAKVTNMVSMFSGCNSLTAIPELDTANVTTMSRMFENCCSLSTIPQMDTAKVKYMAYMFSGCSSLAALPEMDTESVIGMASMFDGCYMLGKLTLYPYADDNNWAGQDISLADCSFGYWALVELLDSLPPVPWPRVLTLTGNPGISELTDEETDIAEEKNWTLVL